jgi:hypothetical protein
MLRRPFESTAAKTVLLVAPGAGRGPASKRSRKLNFGTVKTFGAAAHWRGKFDPQIASMTGAYHLTVLRGVRLSEFSVRLLPNTVDGVSQSAMRTKLWQSHDRAEESSRASGISNAAC